jgi:hypothetical protein
MMVAAQYDAALHFRDEPRILCLIDLLGPVPVGYHLVNILRRASVGPALGDPLRPEDLANLSLLPQTAMSPDKPVNLVLHKNASASVKCWIS